MFDILLPQKTVEQSANSDFFRAVRFKKRYLIIWEESFWWRFSYIQSRSVFSSIIYVFSPSSISSSIVLQSKKVEVINQPIKSFLIRRNEPLVKKI